MPWGPAQNLGSAVNMASVNAVTPGAPSVPWCCSVRGQMKEAPQLPNMPSTIFGVAPSLAIAVANSVRSRILPRNAHVGKHAVVIQFLVLAGALLLGLLIGRGVGGPIHNASDKSERHDER